MSSNALRLAIALVVLVVVGGTLVGIGPGADDDRGGGAPSAAGSKPSTALVARRTAALGAVATQGKAVFDGDSGCGGCHTLAAAGSSAGIGPDLDDVLTDAGVAEIKQDIVDPNAAIAPGYQGGLMPGRFGEDLSPQQVDALARWLNAVTAKP